MEFQSKVACEVGVDGAIMLQNIYFWVKKNEANDKNFHDGKYWTYNSKKAFAVLFPFWSERQIERILDKLRKDEYLEVGNYNATPYDRTLWYTLTDKARILFDGDFHSTKWCNEKDENVEPIPYNNTDIKTNNNYKAVIDYLNEKAGKSFKCVEANNKLIRARYNEGYTLEDFYRVIDYKVLQWKGNEWEKYLRPSTLFSAKNFENYLNDSPPRNIDLSEEVENEVVMKGFDNYFKSLMEELGDE